MSPLLRVKTNTLVQTPLLLLSSFFLAKAALSRHIIHWGFTLLISPLCTNSTISCSQCSAIIRSPPCAAASLRPAGSRWTNSSIMNGVRMDKQLYIVCFLEFRVIKYNNVMVLMYLQPSPVKTYMPKKQFTLHIFILYGKYPEFWKLCTGRGPSVTCRMHVASVPIDKRIMGEQRRRGK